MDKDEQEKLRISMLRCFEGDIHKHTPKDGNFFYSDRKDSNPDSLHNRVLKQLQP